MADAMLKSAQPKIQEAIAVKRRYATDWTFDHGARDLDKAAFALFNDRIAKMGYSAYISIDGNDYDLVSDREFAVMRL
jgi:hypothetical protein